MDVRVNLDLWSSMSAVRPSCVPFYVNAIQVMDKLILPQYFPKTNCGKTVFILKLRTDRPELTV